MWILSTSCLDGMMIGCHQCLSTWLLSDCCEKNERFVVRDGVGDCVEEKKARK